MSLFPRISARTATASFALVFIVTALLFGGMWPIWRACLPFLLAGWALSTHAGVALPHRSLPSSILKGVLPLTAIALAWAVCQMVPHIAFSHPFNSLVHPAWPSLSVNPYATLAQTVYAGALLLTALGLFRLGLIPSTPSRLVRFAALGSLAIAAYGLLSQISASGMVLWLPKTAYQDSLTATFISRNHYATFAGLGLLCCMSLLFERIGEISSRLSPVQRLRALWLLVIRPRWYWALAALFMLITLILTLSRGGLAATGAGAIAMLVSLAIARKGVRVAMLALTGMALAISLLLLGMLGESLGSRFERIDTDAQTRGVIFTLAQNAAMEAPLTGQGFGAFEEVFGPERNVPAAFSVIHGQIDHAHNTYLELVTELGLPASALLFLAAAILLYTMLGGLILRRRAVIWPALGVGGFTLLAVHALVDFSLSIPAVALFAIFIVAVSSAQSEPLPEDLTRQRLATPQVLAVALLALPVMAFSAWNTFAVYTARSASPVIAQLDAGKPVPLTDLLAAQENLRSAIAIMPLNPVYPERLARVTFAIAAQTSNPTSASVQRAQAKALLEKSLSLSPASADNWLRLARYEFARGNFPAAQTALSNSILATPLEARISMDRVPYMLALYPSAGADDQYLMSSNLKTIWPLWPNEVMRRIKTNPLQLAVMRRFITPTDENDRIWYSHTRSHLVASPATSSEPTP